MKIITAEKVHIPAIQQIAEKSWNVAYRDILSPQQIEYMLDMMYSKTALEEQMLNLNHHFFLIGDGSANDFYGFISYEFNYNNEPKTKIHKLYMLPGKQGAGSGKLLIDAVASEAKAQNNNVIGLNMNRKNNAHGFYARVGFEIVKTEDIDIGNGYLMEDYVLEKKI